MSAVLPWRRAVRPPGRPVSGGLGLAARGVSLALSGRPILRDVSVDVRAGELLALVGPNGAGKSTLLSVLSGDLEPDAGSVEIDGRPIGDWTTVELALRRGVLLQQVGLSFPFTVEQVVRMGRAPWAGLDQEDDDDRAIADSMVAADVVELAERVYMTLSGGERARAALARVLAQEPGVLLLDEPTAALDIRHQERVLDLARERARRGDAVAVVMHDLGLAAAHADRVVILSDGRVVAHGRPGDVMTADLLSEVYGCRIETIPHPRTGSTLIVPWRP